MNRNHTAFDHILGDDDLLEISKMDGLPMDGINPIPLQEVNDNLGVFEQLTDEATLCHQLRK